MSESAAKPPRFAAGLLISVLFLNMLGFGIIVPLLPFFAQSFGAPAWQIALIFSAHSLGVCIGEPYWGRLSDKHGRKPLLVFTTLANGLCYLALAFAPSAWAAFFIRLIGGLFSGNASIIQAYVADVTPKPRLARAMSYMGGAFNVGLIVGPSVGGFFAQPEAGHAGFQLPLLIAAGLFGASALCLTLFLRESRAPGQLKVAQPSPWGAAALALRHPIIARLILVTFLGGFAFQGIEAMFALWSKAIYGWGPRDIGIVFGALGLAAALTQFLLSPSLAERFGRGRTMAAGMALTMLAFAAIPIATYGAATILLMALAAMGRAFTWPNTLALLSDVADPNHLGQYHGLNNAMAAFSRVVGPFCAGLAFSALGPHAPFVLCALVAAPGIWLALRATRLVQATSPSRA